MGERSIRAPGSLDLFAVGEDAAEVDRRLMVGPPLIEIEIEVELRRLVGLRVGETEIERAFEPAPESVVESRDANHLVVGEHLRRVGAHYGQHGATARFEAPNEARASEVATSWGVVEESSSTFSHSM